MIWSFSGHRTFIQCRRKWFFMKGVANPRAKNNPIRLEAHLLNQLRSLPAWRGGVVDATIENLIVPALKRRTIPNKSTVLGYAMRLSDAQVAFAKDQRYRVPGMTKSKAGLDYAAFLEVEYGINDLDEKIQNTKAEISAALTNLVSQESLLQMLVDSSWLGAQRALTFTLDEDVTVRANTDLIAFFRGASPLIIDWKASIQRADDYWLQLAVYALALAQSRPHKDWPLHAKNSDINATDVRLIEANLLTNHFKEHKVTKEDLEELQDLILDSAWEMSIAGGADGILEPEDFESAWNPRSCEYCQFRKICW